MKFTVRPHQKSFALAKEKYVGLFGGVGNGKTSIACRKIIEKATVYPNNFLLVGRLTYPELRDSTREVFLSVLRGDKDNPPLYPPEAYSFNKSENSVTFWDKSVVVFRHLDDPRGLLGPNLGGFYIDQAEEVDEESFKILQSRLRRPNVGIAQGYITGNPRGHNWIYYTFGIKDSQGAKDWCFNTDYRMITASTFANAEALPSDYIDQLRRSYSPEWFSRYVEGSWDVFEGQIFDLTKISSYSRIPKILMVVTACDPAISKSDNACNTALCTLGMGEDGYIYDLETIANKWSFLETLDQIRGVIGRHKPRYLGVESVGYQKALTEACRRMFPDMSMAGRIIDLQADRDKIRRARSVSHMVAQGLVRTNNQELLEEVSAFGANESSDVLKDRVDAFVHALHMIQSYAPIPRQTNVPSTAALPRHEWFFKKAVQQMDSTAGEGADFLVDRSYQPEPGYF